MIPIVRLLVVCGLLLGTTAAVTAQTPPAERSPGAFRVQGAVRTRPEAWNWFGPDSEGRYTFVGSTARVGLGQQWERIGWQMEVAAPLLLELPAQATAPAPRGQLGLGAAYRAANGGGARVSDVFLKQAYLRLGGAPGAPSHGLRLGRFEFIDGTEVLPGDPTLAALKRDRVAHRLLGNFGWSHVGRSMDGLHYAFTAPRWNATGIVARPTQGVFNVDGWPGLDIAVAYAALTLRDRVESRGEARLFLLHYADLRDWSVVVKTDNRPVATRQSDREDIEVTTLGGHYIAVLDSEAGLVDLLVWGAVQRGRWGVLDHGAWAGAVEVGWQPPILGDLRPWLRFGHFHGAGDGDAADGRHETFFQVLPTPRIYARFPFYNQMNLRERFASLTLRPATRVSIRSDLRWLDLDSATDLWYAGGGAFEESSFGYAGRPSGGSNELATLVDLSADYRISPSLTGGLYVGYARAGSVIERTYGGSASGSLGFLELEYRW